MDTSYKLCCICGVKITYPAKHIDNFIYFCRDNILNLYNHRCEVYLDKVGIYQSRQWALNEVDAINKSLYQGVMFRWKSILGIKVEQLHDIYREQKLYRITFYYLAY